MREGWEEKRLGEVCNVQRGLTYSRKDTVDISNNIVLRATNISLENRALYFSELKYLRDDFLIKDVYKLKKGSILICFSSGSKSHLGKVALVEKDYNAAFGGFIGQINPSIKIDSRYLFYNLVSERYRNYILSLTDGLNINNLKLGDLKDFQIPIPPLSEQKQIVAILDKAFAAIDQAKANIEKNIVNAKELFQSKLNTSFDKFIVKYNSKKLGSMLEVLTDYHANGSYKVLKENVELKDNEDYAWMVRSTDFEKNFEKSFKYIDEHAYNYLKKSKVFGREIIISKIGNAGKVYVMPEIDRPCSLAMNLFLLRLDNKEMSSKYLYYYLKSTKGERQILSKLNGTTTKTITKDSVRDLNIPFVKVDIQNQVVLEFEKMNKKTKQLENTYQSKLTELEELKKTILQKAFAGALTSPKGTKFAKDGSIPSVNTPTKENPERVL